MKAFDQCVILETSWATRRAAQPVPNVEVVAR
jgi:hypothetical protein